MSLLQAGLSRRSPVILPAPLAAPGHRVQRAPLPRYLQESSWKIDSIRGCNCRAATVCAILSATVGTPKILVPPPCGFGISTARTGGGKYVPEDILFQIL